MNGPKNVNGANILTLGILSIVLCGILGPIAWLRGNEALKVMDYDLENSPYYEGERGLVVAGRICGIVGTVLLILGLIGMALQSSMEGR